MDKLVLVGGGGHCASCIDVIETQGRYEIIGIVDGALPVNDSVLGYPVLGGDEVLTDVISNITANVLITLGQIKSPTIRYRISDKLTKNQAEFPIIVSPKAQVSSHAILQQGTIVMHQAVINARAVIGSFGIINTGAIVEHDAQVGSFCHVSTGAIINGGTRVGSNCFIGSRSVLYQGIEVVGDTVIPAGMVVRKSVEKSGIFKG